MHDAADTDDIFAILDIEAREDTYSCLLVKLLKRSSALRRRLLAHALGESTPSTEPESIALRHDLKDAGVVDILLIGPGSRTPPTRQPELQAGVGVRRALKKGRWTPENIGVHLEMELTPSPPWRLKLHFETEPYLTRKELAGITGHEDFVKLRESFRHAFHAAGEHLPGWKMTNYVHQVATRKADVGVDATVQQLRDCLAPALSQVAPYITEALKAARQAA